MAAPVCCLAPITLLAVALIAGCTQSSPPQASSPGPSTSSAFASLSSASPSDSPTESFSVPIDPNPTDSVSPSDLETSPSDPETSLSDESSPTSPGPVPSTASGRPLTLADVFSTEGDWKDDRFDITDRVGLPGIGTVTNACGPDYAPMLELRLARGFTSLRMVVGQANDSKSSDAILVVTIVANGKQIDTRRVPFDKLQTFRENITAVNALQIFVFIDPESCNRSSQEVTAVIQGLTVS